MATQAEMRALMLKNNPNYKGLGTPTIPTRKPTVIPPVNTQQVAPVASGFRDQGLKSIGTQTTEGIATKTGVIKSKPTTVTALSTELNQRGANASKTFGTDVSKYDARDEQTAQNIVASGETPEAYLAKQAGFSQASATDQANTLDAIKKRIGAFGTTAATEGEVPPTTETATTGKPGYYKGANGEDIAILGYGDLDTETQGLIDQMSDADKKLLDMKWGNDVQGKAEYLRQGKREQEYAKGQRDLTIKIQDLEGKTLEIQASQRLRDAGKNVDNLIQNYAYLGQMGAPGVSSQRLTAVAGHITEAEKKFAELKQIEANVAQIRQLGLKIDTAQYEKQMADIADDLNMKVGSQIQNALNDMTAADMAGQLDTVDGITQFKRSLLERLDNSISGYTEGSLKQMQYVTEQYTKIADDAQVRIKERQTNANTINSEMSTVKGYYVDGNGSPIYDSKGDTIVMPEKPPMDPIFDKTSGKLITFSNDANGQIVAKVQQAIPEATFAQQTVTNYAQLVNSGKLKMSDVPADMQESVANAMATVPTQGYTGPQYTPVDTVTITANVNQVKAQGDGSVGGQCGAFVNDYLQGMGLGRMFIDPIDAKKANKNSDTPTVGSVAIFDYSSSPNSSLAQQKYGHVAVVTAVDLAKGTMTLKESNKAGEEKVFSRTVPINKAYGFFDPTKALETAGTEGQGGATYNGLSQEDQNYVDALAGYQADLPSKMNKNYTKYISAAKEIDPNRDQNKYSARKKFLGDWAAGSTAQNITSINTTVGHLSTLLTASKGLGNSKVQIKNTFTNRAKDQFGDPSITNFDTAADAVGSELAKVFKGGTASPTEQEIKERSSIFTKSKSEEQLNAAVKQAAKLLSSRMKALTETYNRNIGKYPDESILYPETIETLNIVGIDPNQFVGGAIQNNQGGSYDDIIGGGAISNANGR